MAWDHRQSEADKRYKRLMMTARSARWLYAILASLPKARLTHLSMMIMAIALITGCETTGQNDDPYGWKAEQARQHHGFFPWRLRSDGMQCKAEWRRAPPLQHDLWYRVVQRYQLPNSTTNDRIVTERNWYAKHQTYLDRMSGRSARYLYFVANKLEERKLPGELALLPIVESAYNPFAISHSQASGLWQFIPSTAKFLKMEMNWWYDARRDIPASTDTALDYLVFLRDHYNGDWLKALAAYNAGWGAIDRAVEKNRAKGLPTDYWSLDVPDETMAYVPKLLALAQISKNPANFGVGWAYIPDLPYFSEVRFEGQLDVSLAADLANVNSDELYLLNPGISRWATPPGGPYRLLVPIDEANELQERIASMSAGEKMPSPNKYTQTANPMMAAMEEKVSTFKPKPTAGSRTYVVKSGDTYWSVAKKTGTTADALRKLNKLPSNEPLKLGQTIILPGSSKVATSTKSAPIKAAPTKTTSIETNNGAPVAASQPANIGKSTHTVQAGDTLMAISRKFNVSVDNLARWNGLNKSHAILKPGQTLIIRSH